MFSKLRKVRRNLLASYFTATFFRLTRRSILTPIRMLKSILSEDYMDSTDMLIALWLMAVIVVLIACLAVCIASICMTVTAITAGVWNEAVTGILLTCVTGAALIASCIMR